MAEIVTWVTETTRTNTGRWAPEPSVATSTRTRVTSIRTDRMDVSVLRDLCRALDQANAPGRARVTCTSSDMIVEWVHEPAPAEELPVAGPPPDGGADCG